MRTKALVAGLVLALLVVCPVMVRAADYTCSASSTSCGPYALQTSAATGNGLTVETGGWVPMMQFVLTWDQGTTAGAVTLETVEPGGEAYAGTWAPLVAVSWDAASSKDHVAVMFPAGVYRSRISTEVTNSGTQVVPAANVTLATNVIQTAAAHGWVAGQKLVYKRNGGTAMTYATGVSLDATVVYVKTAPAADTFTISLTSGGATLDLDGQGNNAQSFVPGGVSVTARGIRR